VATALDTLAEGVNSAPNFTSVVVPKGLDLEEIAICSYQSHSIGIFLDQLAFCNDIEIVNCETLTI
jgi:hypothetical protein